MRSALTNGINYWQINRDLQAAYARDNSNLRALKLARKVKRHMKWINGRRMGLQRLNTLDLPINWDAEPIDLARQIMENNLTLLILDLEYSFETNQIFEVGFTFVQNGEIESRNLRILSRPNQPRFQFGHTERVDSATASAITVEYLDKADLILVYGGGTNDLKMFNRVGKTQLDPKRYFDISIFSRHMVSRVDGDCSRHLSLKKFARAVGVNATRFHNAGNDSRIAYEALKAYVAHGGLRHIPNNDVCHLCIGTGLHGEVECPACEGSGDYYDMIQHDYRGRPGQHDRIRPETTELLDQKPSES